GVEHGVDFFQQRWRLLDGDKVAGVRAVIENFFQQNRKAWPRFSLQVAQEASQISYLGDVAQEERQDKSFVFARFGEPVIVRVPLFFRGIPGQRRFAPLVEGEAVGKRVRLGLAVADAGAAYECIKGHKSLSSTD